MASTTAAEMPRAARKSSQRLQLTCEPCRSAKLKCDRTLPICDQCYRRSRESTCRYTERGRKYISAAQNPTSMKAKVERLEQLVSLMKRSPPGPDATTAINDEVNTAESFEAAPKSEESVVSRLGSLKLSRSGSTHWLGPGHWESCIDDIADIKAYFEREEEQTDGDHPDATWTSRDGEVHVPNVDVAVDTPDIYSKEALLEQMPTRPELNRAIATWFNVLDQTRVLVHGPTFQAQYQQFWLDQNQVGPAWLAMMFATASIGAELAGQSSNDPTSLARAELLRRLTGHAIVLADSGSPQPFLIEAFVLHTTSILFRHHEANNTTWHLIGQTMRLCFLGGYHREPSHNPAISPFECEMRRRIWMAASELEISISNTLGMASCIDHTICDVRSPSNLTDIDFGPNGVGPPRPWEEVNLVQTEICFASMIAILGEATTLSHRINLPARSEVQALNSRLADLHDRLPSKLKMAPLSECFLDSPSEIIDRLRIEFAYQKAVCVLHRQFLGNPNYELEHERCMNAARTIVEQSIAMLEAAQPGGLLASLRVMFVRHIHDFKHAAVLMCSELKRLSSLDSTETPIASEDRAKLLQACLLWSEPGIPSPKSRGALDTMIRFLRNEQSKSPDIDEGLIDAKHSTSPLPSVFGEFSQTGQLSMMARVSDPLVTPEETGDVLAAELLDPRTLVHDDLQSPWYWSVQHGQSDDFYGIADAPE